MDGGRHFFFMDVNNFEHKQKYLGNPAFNIHLGQKLTMRTFCGKKLT
jgi:hypothetical protein